MFRHGFTRLDGRRRRGRAVVAAVTLGMVVSGFAGTAASAAAPVKPTPKAPSKSHAAKIGRDVALPEQPYLNGSFVAAGPTRLLDTRTGIGNHGVAAKIGQHAFFLDVSKISGNSSVTPTAVVLNVTVTNPTASSYLTVSPYEQIPPTTSNLNFTAGRTIANQVTVPVGSDGTIAIADRSGTADVIVDLAGYYTLDKAGANYTADGPARLLDTRIAKGAPKAPIPGGHAISLTVAGVNGVPKTGVSAVVMNVTATDTTASGFLTVYPDGQKVPTASNLNFVKGQTVPNLVTVPVGADGKVDFYNSGGTTDVVADLAGYYLTKAPQSGGTFQTLNAPTRFLDTRQGLGAPKAPVHAGRSIALQIDGGGGNGGVSTADVSAVVMNVTVTDTTSSGFLTVYPDGQKVPTASNLNFVKGQTVPNLVTVPVGADGKVDFYNSGGTTDVVADVVGYFSTGKDLRFTSVAFGSPTVDASTGSATDTLTWTLNDTDPAATQTGGEVVIRQRGATPDSYIGQAYIVDFSSTGDTYNGAGLVSGNAASSTYSYTFPVPQYAGATSATWAVSTATAYDFADQQRQVLAGSDLAGFAASHFTATEQVATQTPQNGYVWLNGSAATQPDYLYSGVNNYVQYLLDAQDYQSGFWKGTVTVSGPGGRTVSGSFEELDDNNQQSGPCQQQITDAQCWASVRIPAGSPSGAWSVSSLTLTNNAGQTKTYTGLNLDPVTVTADSPLSASGFKASPASLNSWTQAQPFQVSMRIAGARSGVSSIQLTWSDTSYCTQTATTPTVDADGGYSVPVRLAQSNNGHAAGCQLLGVVVLDGAGDVALYGASYQAPSLGDVTVQSVADTTPPTVSSAALNVTTIKQSQIGSQSVHVAVKVGDPTAPVNQFGSHLYDSTGADAGQESGALSVGPDGSASIDLYLPNGLAVGTYTVGFSVTDAGWLTTTYGPKGLPVPGGALTLTVTAG
ncbi:RHS repeat domain-containing protein [Streptacidiphilus rugosus]|uniref:hypothetical protein n=1 Tax=Streptacidiphilus rugosus TaxID=405783 RepID=UPI0007C7A68C|nr:hypothetical protein [Streptacidiphilus rugosus]